MGTVDLPKSGKTARPQTKSAQLPHGTGENNREPQPGPGRGVEPELRGSPLASLDRIIREQAASLSNRLGAKLPGEAMPRLDEKVYNFISRNYRIISGSFPPYGSGDSGRKNSGVKNTAIEMMLEGEGNRFNRGEIEKAARQWGIGSLEAHTDNMLRRKAGIGSVVDSQKANSVVACVFKDNVKKPKTVTDLRLAVNIPETELLASESMFKAGAAYLIREIICRRLSERIDGETDMDSVLNDKLEINPEELDGYLQKFDWSDEIEEIRNRGFSSASNLIVSILNAVNLDCQFLENHKEKRELLIREYEDADEDVLPDEHYQIRLRYFSKTRLLEEREFYDGRLKALGDETLRLWNLLEVIYQDSKSVFKVNDFEDLVKKNKGRINNLIKNRTGVPVNEEPKVREISYPPNTKKMRFSTSQEEKENIRLLLAAMEERINNISDSMYTSERKISVNRLAALKHEFSFVENDIDPYNLQPGMLVDIELTSIKRKRTTLDSMSAALGNFLANVSGCFCDT
jgi:hypothetical protein